MDCFLSVCFFLQYTFLSYDFWQDELLPQMEERKHLEVLFMSDSRTTREMDLDLIHSDKGDAAFKILNWKPNLSIY